MLVVIQRSLVVLWHADHVRGLWRGLHAFCHVVHPKGLVACFENWSPVVSMRSQLFDCGDVLGSHARRLRRHLSSLLGATARVWSPASRITRSLRAACAVVPLLRCLRLRLVQAFKSECSGSCTACLCALALGSEHRELSTYEARRGDNLNKQSSVIRPN